MTTDKARFRFISTSDGATVVGDICDECISNCGVYSAFGSDSNVCCFNKAEKCFNHNPFYVFVKKSDSEVIVFSKLRVTFCKPKNYAFVVENLKDDIIKAIKNLQAKENHILQARYGTTDEQSFYDIENVLFYNLGTKNFKHLVNNGVKLSVVSREDVQAMYKKYNIPKEYLHYYEYSIASISNDKNADKILAKWNDISLKCTNLKPSIVWKTFKEEKKKIQVFDRIETNKGECFSVHLNVEKPKNIPFNIVTAMKPLLDGIICAFHTSQFDETELDWVSKIINCDKLFLMDNTTNVLGERKNKYVQKYCNSIKWNPSDDLCKYVFINVKEGNEWNLSGKLYSIKIDSDLGV